MEKKGGKGKGKSLEMIQFEKDGDTHKEWVPEELQA